jgi:catechol 2,3-dioxygenase-like lactoylglutathione lyase family enzyme
VTGTPYFHVGILVEDLEAAVDRFSKVLGLTFNDPLMATFDCLEDPDPHEGFVRCTYSRQGPPFIELLEANGDGLFSLAGGEGVHHVGYWDADVDARCALLSGQGVEREARVANPDGTTFSAFTRREDLFGLRLEVLHDASREATERWIATGVFAETTDGQDTTDQ